MRAAIFHGPNTPLTIEDRPTPEPGDGEILVKVAACGVCHTDLHYIDHGTPTFKKPPMILGHEAAGIVAKVGRGVKKFTGGERVLLPAVVACGTCEYCRTGRENICASMVMFGNHVDGAYAEYFVAPAKDAFILPREIPLIEGAIIADAISTPYHAVVNRAEVKPGDTIAVVGCGGVGANVVQIAAAVGGQVIAIDLSEAKLERARKFGAVATINPSTVENVAKEVRKLTGGGAAIAIEAIGTPKTIELAFSTLRRGGRLVIVGFSAQDAVLPAAKVMFHEMEIRGSLGCRVVDYPRIIELARRGTIKVAEMVTHRFPLERINDAMELLRAHDESLLRAVVIPDAD
jgi:6-hydroxycyclohex-1-ene-1-carbonyl-CoA dehydrogenase